MDRMACVETALSKDRATFLLRTFSPEVAPCDDEPGVYWLAGAGMERLFPTPSLWGRAIRKAFDVADKKASVVVGFTRFGTYAAVKLGQPLLVLRDPAAERKIVKEVPLARLSSGATGTVGTIGTIGNSSESPLALSKEFRSLLEKLEVHTLGQYLALPRGGILLRFGQEASRLHALAAGEAWDPMEPEDELLPIETRMVFDEPILDGMQLLFALKRGLGALLAELSERHQALASLLVEMKLDGAPVKLEVLRPADPTLDMRTLMRLLQLRIEASPPEKGVRELHMEALGVLAAAEQLELFLRQGVGAMDQVYWRSHRDLQAANEALAQLRAELGNGAVCRAVICDGHLPEAQFRWAPLERVQVPWARAIAPLEQKAEQERTLIRRIYAQPGTCPIALGKTASSKRPAVRVHGPFLVSATWWSQEISRAYAFVDTQSGESLWVYFDRMRRQWRQQGSIE